MQRGEAEAVKETGIPMGGGTATIERGDAEAIPEDAGLDGG